MGAPAVKIVKRKSVTVVSLSGAMTIENIGELKSWLLKAFSFGKDVQLSLKGVTEVDLTGLQLLCSAHRTSIARELHFSVTGAAGEVVSSVADLTGMMRHAGCASDSNGTCVWKKSSDCRITDAGKVVL
jgi:anti-anti-sigma factor